MFKVRLLSLFLMSSCAFSAPPLRFISLDGGGMLEVIPLSLLSTIEAELGPISSLVDGMMGSSSGGIVAAMLSTPTGQSGPLPKYSCAEILESYRFNAMKVFNAQAFINAAFYFAGLSQFANFPKAAEPFEELLEAYMGGVYLSHALKPLMITAYNIKTKKVDVFDSVLAEQDANRDLPLAQVVRATTALPFFFGHASLQFNNSAPETAWMDAGLHGYNDPTAFLCARLLQRFPNRDLVVYSLGTGLGTSPWTHAYAQAYPQLKVVRIEPDFSSREGGAVRTVLSMVTLSNHKAENLDMNYLGALPFESNMDYLLQQADALRHSAEFQDMLSDLRLPLEE